MSSKRRRRRRECGEKRHYANLAEAQEVALRRRKPGERLRPYKCRFGPHWHIGHTPKKVRQAIAARRKELWL